MHADKTFAHIQNGLKCSPDHFPSTLSGPIYTTSLLYLSNIMSLLQCIHITVGIVRPGIEWNRRGGFQNFRRQNNVGEVSVRKETKVLALKQQPHKFPVFYRSSKSNHFAWPAAKLSPCTFSLPFSNKTPFTHFQISTSAAAQVAWKLGTVGHMYTIPICFLLKH